MTPTTNNSGKGPEIDISIDTSEDFETITLSFMTEEKQMTVGFAIAEAQMLSVWLNEAITAVLVHKMELH